MVRNNVDLDVSVVESDGATNRFIVPASQVRARNLSRPLGLTLSVGQVRSIESEYSDPLVMNISDGWRISPWMNLRLLVQLRKTTGQQAAEQSS